MRYAINERLYSVQHLGDGSGSTAAKDQSFQQRVAGKPVSSVNASAGDLADGVQLRQGCPAPGINRHAAHKVMRGRCYWNQIARQVKTMLRADSGDGRKAGAHGASGQMAQIEKSEERRVGKECRS